MPIISSFGNSSSSSSKLLSNMGISKSRGISQNGWFIWENLIKMDDLEVTLFLETPIFISLRLIGPNGGANRTNLYFAVVFF